MKPLQGMSPNYSVAKKNCIHAQCLAFTADIVRTSAIPKTKKRFVFDSHGTGIGSCCDYVSHYLRQNQIAHHFYYGDASHATIHRQIFIKIPDKKQQIIRKRGDIYNEDRNMYTMYSQPSHCPLATLLRSIFHTRLAQLWSCWPFSRPVSEIIFIWFPSTVKDSTLPKVEDVNFQN